MWMLPVLYYSLPTLLISNTRTTLRSIMFPELLVAAGLLGIAVAFPRLENLPLYAPGPSDTVYEDHQYQTKLVKKPYTFDYGVRDDYTGANFGHQEDSDGKVIKGSYTVALPDGRTQRVTYTADHESGFQAEVTYEGEAIYPEHPTDQNLQQLEGRPHNPYKPPPQQSAPHPPYPPSLPFPEDRSTPDHEEKLAEYSN